MSLPLIENDPFAQRADALYNDRIRPLVEPAHHGEYVVIDVESGEYEVDSDQLAATHRLKERKPAARIWVRRAGYSFVHSFASVLRHQEQQ